MIFRLDGTFCPELSKWLQHVEKNDRVEMSLKRQQNGTETLVVEIIRESGRVDTIDIEEKR